MMKLKRHQSMKAFSFEIIGLAAEGMNTFTPCYMRGDLEFKTLKNIKKIALNNRVLASLRALCFGRFCLK